MVTPGQAEHLRAMPQGEIPLSQTTPSTAPSTAGGGGRDLVLHTSAQPPTCSYTDPHQPGGHKGSGNLPEPRALPAPNLQPNFQTQTSRSRALHDVKWCCLKHKNKAGCRSSFSYLPQDTQGSTPAARASPAPSLGQFEAHPALLKGEQLQQTPPCLHLS